MTPPKQVFPPAIDGRSYRKLLAEDFEPLARLASWMYNNIDMDDEKRLELMAEYQEHASKSARNLAGADRTLALITSGTNIISFAKMIGCSGNHLSRAIAQQDALK